MKIIRAIIFLSCLISSSFASELSWGELPLDDEFASHRGMASRLCLCSC